jgi:hypothetical protein
VPIVELVRSFGIAGTGAGKFRRVNGVARGEPRDEGAIGPETPGAVQINERRPAAGDFDFGFDPVLPKLQPAYFGSGHV